MFRVTNSSIVVQSTTKERKSPLSKALQYGEIEGAQKIIEQTCKMGGQFSLIEQWQIKVFKNSDFNDDEFLVLSPEIKVQVYRTANNFNKIALVARLNLLGMTAPKWPIETLDIITEYMDSALVNKTIFDFLIKLRQEGRLLTQKECDVELDNSYIKKYDFTRMLGHARIKYLIEKLQLKHIKVPKKIAVVKSEEELSVEVKSVTKEVVIAAHEISIYAQRISRAERFLSREEVLELFSIIEASNFVDLWPNNFMVAEDGIYFIDTEFKSFSGTLEWEKMGRLQCFIANEDREWFFELIQDRIKAQRNEPMLKLQNLGKIYMRYVSLKYGDRERKAVTDFVVRYRENIQIAKAVGLFSTDHRLFSFPVKDILQH